MGWSATSLAYWEQNVEYHEGQQAMVDRYFELWRTSDRHLDAKMRPLPEWMRGVKFNFKNL